jgi:hypothetical protein
LGIEILRRKPSFQRGLYRGPFSVNDGKPSGVPVSTFQNVRLPENSFKLKSEALRRID